jgi:HPt (histidine-containing phosphotransfer) domain-containing protein
VARCIVQKGWDLVALQQAAMSLEDVFLQLTTADQAEGVPASAAVPEVTA